MSFGCSVAVFRRFVVALILTGVVGFVGIAPSSPAWADGTSWSTVVPPEDNSWRSIAYGNGVWVAVANSGTNQVMRSTDDGLSWTAVAAAEANRWYSVAYGNGVWVAVAYSGTNQVMRSTDDGLSWTAVAAAEANGWYSVAYGNGVWVAVANSGTNRVMRSTDDGLSWTAVAAAEANLWYSVAYGNGVWVAVAYSGTNRLMRSVEAVASSASASSSIADAGVPGIFLFVAGPVGRSAAESPVYYGADRVAVTSTYLLTVTRVSNVTPTITTLAEGTIDADGSFTSMTRLPALAPGTYNVQMVGTHVNGSTLQLTSQVTIGGVGQFTSIGANIPVIR